MNQLEYFDFYTKKLNWEIIPCHPDTKQPVLEKWTKSYDIELCRSYFEESTNYNFGLLLGKTIIDVEGDTEKGNKLIDDLSAHVPHPIYVSSKSKHHLFLANPKYEFVPVNMQKRGVEFRGGNGQQSLLPPSICNDTHYQWVTAPTVELVQMSGPILNYYCRAIPKDKKKKKSCYIQVRCAKCTQEIHIHPKRFAVELAAFKTKNSSWLCRKCRKIDLNPLCRRIKKRVRRSLVS